MLGVFSYNVALWLTSFVAMACLLGILMYMLICLSDLENDFINPHDSAKRINKFVIPEYVAQGVLGVLLLATGNWAFACMNLAVTAFHIHKAVVKKNHLVDVTEIFNQLPSQKKERLVKLGLYLVFFVYIIYRLVESAVKGLMGTAAGAALGKKVVKETAKVVKEAATKMADSSGRAGAVADALVTAAGSE